MSVAAAACASKLKDLNSIPGLSSVMGLEIQNLDSDKISLAKHDNCSVVSDDSISVSSDDDMEDRPGKVEALGKALQKKILKGCFDSQNGGTNTRWEMKVKQMMIKFVRMFLYDYHPDSYFYIRAILLDCKGIIEDYNLDEQKEFLMKGLKLIKEKCSNEDIPFCGAGGFEL